MGSTLLKSDVPSDMALARAHTEIARYRARHGEENATIDHSDALTIIRVASDVLMNPEATAIRLVACERSIEMLWAAVRNLNYQWGEQL